jgi:hypothetical protein
MKSVISVLPPAATLAAAALVLAECINGKVRRSPPVHASNLQTGWSADTVKTAANRGLWITTCGTSACRVPVGSLQLVEG